MGVFSSLQVNILILNLDLFLHSAKISVTVPKKQDSVCGDEPTQYLQREELASAVN